MKNNKSIAILFLVLGFLVLASAITRIVVGSIPGLSERAANLINGTIATRALPQAIDDVTSTFDTGNAVRDQSTESFPLDQVKKISLRNKVGTIRVQVGPDAKNATLQVTKVISANTISQDEARARLQKIQISTNQTGDVETIEAVYPQDFVTPLTGYHVDFILTVPPTIALDVQQNAGNVETNGLASPVNVTTDAGKIQIIGYADTAKAITKTGSVQIEGGQNIKNIDAETAVGEVQVSLPNNANLKVDATTAVGTIHSAIPLNDTSTNDKRTVHGTIGTGNDGQVTLNVKTGAITINQE